MSDLDTDYINIGKELFTVLVIAEGTSNVSTNFNDMKIVDWTKLTLNTIQKYSHIYNKLVQTILQKTNYIDKLHHNCILCNIQLFLPENYDFIKKEILSTWINKYKSQLQSLYDEDKCDLSWYESHSSDCFWAHIRMKNISEITKTIDEYVLINSNNTNDDGN